MERERAPSNERPSSSNPDVFTLKLSGLPWTATKQQICDFLFGCEVIEGPAGVKIEMNERGKPSGSAFVQLKTKTDVENALKCNKKKLGTRHVYVEKMNNKDEKAKDEKFCIKLSGLARKVTDEDVSNFLFAGNVKHMVITRTVQGVSQYFGHFDFVNFSAS